MLTQQLPEVARLFTHERDVRMLFQPGRDFLGKRHPINGERLPGGYSMVLGDLEDE